MPMEIWTDLTPSLTVDDVLRGQGADPQKVRERRPILVKAAGRSLVEGIELLHPAAYVAELAVAEIRHERILLENSHQLTGSLVAHHLTGAKRIVAVVCTIGLELEELCSSLFNMDMLSAMALDGLGNAAVDHLGQLTCQRIAENEKRADMMTSTPFSPGDPEWPVEIGQPELFALLPGISQNIHLTSGGMMIPKKSISFIVGIGSDFSQSEPCEVCSLNETCRYRHV